MTIFVPGIVSQEQAEAEGFTVDTHCNPPFAYKGPRFNPTHSRTCFTNWEWELFKALRNLLACDLWRNLSGGNQHEIEEAMRIANRVGGTNFHHEAFADKYIKGFENKYIGRSS